MKYPKSLLAIVSINLLLILLFSTCAVAGEGQVSTEHYGKKVLWVDSYHQGYPWSDGIELGIKKALQKSGVKLHVHRMGTKNNNSAEFCTKAGILVKKELDTLQPALVIATDDNAQRCFVVPYLKGTDTPVVFGGVNWSVDEYGYPTENITGMVEIDLVDELVSLMREDASGNRIGFLSSDVMTARKTAQEINSRFFDGEMRLYMVKTFAEFKQQFLQAQQEVDMLILYNYMGIEDWDSIAAESFLTRKTSIPTGAMLDFLKQFAVYTNSKSPEELGEYSGRTALRILSGVSPADIPVTKNKNSKLSVNLKIAKAAHILFPLSVLKTAEIYGRDTYEEQQISKHESVVYQGKKVLWVDSYREGFAWSDGIGLGIREVFVDKGIQFKIVHMDSKRKKSPELIRRAALETLKEIEAFEPDAIITSDDNAQKYLAVPYLLQKKIPIIFCGVNDDATMYGYPRENVTGMLEVEPIDALMKLLTKFAKGKRVGYLSGNTETEAKTIANYQREIFDGRLQIYKAETFEDFKRFFLRAQNEVDMMILPNHGGIVGWQADAAEEFILEHVRIPTGSFAGYMNRYVLFTMANSPVEQGNYAANSVLRVFNGEKIKNMPLSANKTGDTTINLKIADAASLVLPLSTLKEAKTVIGQDVFYQQ
jgi:ABC-type uncharacterized transport system substrate-binding protein